MDEWKKFAKAATFFMFLASLLVCVGIIYALKSISFVGTAPVTNTITVSGHGEAFLAPDIATVSYSVEKTAKTVADAQAQVTTLSNDVLATLKTLGIADADIKTTSYDVYPKYDYTSAVCTTGVMSSSGGASSGAISMPSSIICPPSKQVISGYTVSQSVSVKIRKIDTSGAVLSALGQKNVSNISGLTFTVENDTAVTADARSKAIVAAKTKADTLAKQLGVRLVRITSFSESGSAQPIYYAKDMMVGTGASAPVPSIPVGQNKASSDVSITYEIQ